MKKDTYNVNIDPKADKYLSKLSKKNKKDFEILIRHIKELSSNPLKFEDLKDSSKGEKRFRKGKYRIIFSISKTNPSEITILQIGKRANIYKK